MNRTPLKKRSILLMLAALFLVGLCVCDEPKKNQSDAPAGHPDELKDSTRFDAAPDSELRDQQAPE